MHYGDNNINTGPLKEFKEICIDRFTGDDLKSTTFFLSHAHTDHMVGLDTAAFSRRLQDPEVKLYCQTLTPMFVAHFERYLGGQTGIADLIRARKLVSLDADKPITLEIPAKPRSYSVKVTLIRAGHCPGSVMFLFETESKRILHTGDFRLSLTDLKTIDYLHVGPQSQRKPKTIDHLYVDTTFCSSGAPTFPCRQQATQETIEHVREWINAEENNYVNISFPARFAHEYTLMALYEAFDKKIHVDEERFEIYDMIPGLQDCVTLNPKTPFHLKCNSEVCKSGKEYMTVRLSSLWYTKGCPAKNTINRPSIVKYGRNITVCYAMHSSLNEIAEMIDYLKPTIVTPLVNPAGADIANVNGCLRSICKWNFEFENYTAPQTNSKSQSSSSCSRKPRKCFGAATAKTIDTKKEEDERYDKANDDTDRKCAPEIPEFPEDLESEEEEESAWSPKRFKRDDVESSKWDFPWTPSPRRKNSDSSANSSRNNSQEIAAAKVCNSEATKVCDNDAFNAESLFGELSQSEINSNSKEEQEQEMLGVSENTKVIRNLNSSLESVIVIDDSGSETSSFPSNSMEHCVEDNKNSEENTKEHVLIDLTFDN